VTKADGRDLHWSAKECFDVGMHKLWDLAMDEIYSKFGLYASSRSSYMIILIFLYIGV
jgi:hypothetical protein